MTDVAVGRSETDWLDADTFGRLGERLDLALRRAREGGVPVLISVSTECRAARDPSAVVAASRRPGEPWFCFEQRDREESALAAFGGVCSLEAHGPNRFSQISTRWRAVASTALPDAHAGPPGAGLVALGGFAFAPEGGSSPDWAGFAPASLIVPEVALTRRAGSTWLTINAEVSPDDTRQDLIARVQRRVGELRSAPLPLLDPAPRGEHRVRSSMPPSHYEEAVARAVQRIRQGELEKIVLAREVQVRAPSAHDPAALISVLREAFPACYVFAVGRGDSTFLGASPELLVRREGQRASTVALAGSTRRSADPAVDDHLGEQLLRSDKDRAENEIVVKRITRALRRCSVWVTSAPEPAVVRVANIQHLATPIRAQLAQPVAAVDLAGLLHPTPAVGGEPEAAAVGLIPALEGLDRGWYAGPIGWTDGAGDGEFCVALRCALLHGSVAHCYAGCGIVRDSEPAAELAESEVKLQAMLPLLAA